MGTIKKKRPEMIIGLCGCMMQEKEEVAKIHKSYPFVDLIFGTHNIFKLAELLVEVLESGKRVTEVWDGTSDIVESLPSEQEYAFKDGVNIMYGCNNFCSYCIVPYVRGRERSRQPEEIIQEIKALVKKGTKEIMLLGQNVNSYGKTLDEPMTFAELLKLIDEIEGLERLRFMTPHPKDLSDDLIEVMAHSKTIMPHLHLPIQSGSTKILKKMNRHYTKEDYLNLVSKIKKAIPDISLTTDIMVGFPEEEEEDFLDTLDVVDKVGYDSAFTFIYSKRTGTPAAENPNQVDEEIVKDRFARLLRLVQNRGRERIERFQGRVESALVETVNEKQAGYMTARTRHNVLVHFPGDETLIGQIIDVKLNECKGFYYMGEQA